MFETIQSKIKKFLKIGLVKEEITDITPCFHPDNITTFSGIGGAYLYWENVKRNNESFGRQTHTIVFPSADIKTDKPLFNEENIKPLIAYINKNSFMGIEYKTEKSFYGRYKTGSLLFDKDSYTVRGPETDLDLAVKLAEEFNLKGILLRDCIKQKTYLIENNTRSKFYVK